jgi:predicted alpha/beta-fold hydrolase
MSNEFKPAWWLPGAHLQTLWPALFRRKIKIKTKHERLELTDGDFLDLAWIGQGEGPLVLLLHGLNGSIESHYINGMLHAIEQSGWRGVLMHFRGCSHEPNRLARSYHSGETNDLITVLNDLNKREPKTPIFVIGYSLGANVLLKALGTCQLPNVKAAVAVSIPFELEQTALYMSKGLAYWYQRHLVRGLIKNYKLKFKNLHGPVSLAQASKLRTFWEFDDAITSPLHGFKDAAEYYKISSSRQYLKDISIPTLILHAKNDPFTNSASLPQSHEISAKVSFKLTNDGGHVGFVTGKFPWKPVYWLEQQIIKYLIEHLP